MIVNNLPLSRRAEKITTNNPMFVNGEDLIKQEEVQIAMSLSTWTEENNKILNFVSYFYISLHIVEKLNTYNEMTKKTREMSVIKPRIPFTKVAENRINK